MRNAWLRFRWTRSVSEPPGKLVCCRVYLVSRRSLESSYLALAAFQTIRTSYSVSFTTHVK
jgi:hypothetical protein